ncbi:hypothetical protein PVAG01_03646 [Phlyctema vagabunda]|uniref:Uncharacterized protein n=1 Tax=Phlyctema vagabunda TaxID=108571 RepID=A0ABR4PM00_9HELO
MEVQIPYNDHEQIDSQLSKSQRLEQAYDQVTHTVQLVGKDEDARRLRVRMLLLEHDNNDLHYQLAQADDRMDDLAQDREELRTQLDETIEIAAALENEMRSQTREITNLKIELEAMNGLSMDSTKLLTEKLSLSRELAAIKPELDHLRSQATYQQTVLSEKLALERQVSTLEVELETEKRASLRAARKNDNTAQEAELQREIDSLQKDLTRERKELEKARKKVTSIEEKSDAEKDASTRQKSDYREKEQEYQQQIENLQKKLTSESKALSKAQEQIDNLESKLETVEKQATKVANNKSVSQETELELRRQIDVLREEVLSHQRQSEKDRKEARKELNASEARVGAVESKLEQLRTKLRSTKEELKECKAELSATQASLVRAKSTAAIDDSKPNKPRKRTTQEPSTDDAIGTPDGVAARGKRPTGRRGRADQTMLGEKSMFSITPYLNRTVNMAPESPDDEDPGNNNKAPHNDGEESEAALSPQEKQSPISKPMQTLSALEQASSPSAEPQIKPKRNPSEKNAPGVAKDELKAKRPMPKKSRPLETLEKVTEEDDNDNEENVDDEPVVSKRTVGIKKQVSGKVSSIGNMDDTESEPKKKKRKLLGGGKTLFEEEDGDSTKRPAKVVLGPSKLLNRGGLAGPKGSLRGGLGSGGGGFGAFSPLKKDKRGVGASFLG